MSELAAAAQDVVVAARRGLLRGRREPRLLALPLLQPVLFMMLFGVVLGGVIRVPGVADYAGFLTPGLIVQAVALTAGLAAVDVARDVHRGMVDRFRALPAPGAAVLFGRTVSDLVRIALTAAVAAATGVIAGWRVHSGPAAAAAGFLLVLTFGYAVAWLSVALGLSARTPRAARTVLLVCLMPLTFVSNVLAPPDTMPPWLRPLAEANPVSAVVTALRLLWGDEPAGSGATPASAYPLALVWIFAALLAAIPLALRRYRRTPAP
ncbi:ABC transporter permease [Catellatospora coxensis]|uniref:Transport permease protein n=1 Tax=Catellatospora coxensis TaxID=310354 RepID=A0A8J3PAB1_9ACTN|nr:ABC transporter permease [Catellatospora coxensis]GIG09647.1 transport permease protein [Catellatospora coxensis]